MYFSSLTFAIYFYLLLTAGFTSSIARCCWTQRDNPDIDRSEVNTFIRPTIFAGFGAISFAFVCQSSSFLVYRSMSKGGVDRWACVSRWSVSIAFVMGLTLALGGYLNFVNETQGNILNNFSTEHKAASVARGFLAVTMVSRGSLPVFWRRRRHS